MNITVFLWVFCFLAILRCGGAAIDIQRMRVEGKEFYAVLTLIFCGSIALAMFWHLIELFIIASTN